jgi:hypothetical protein
MKLTDKEIRMKFLSLAFIGVLLITSCESEENSSGESDTTIQTVNLESVRFLEGVWVDRKTFGFKNPPNYIMEKWTSYPDSLSGAGYTLKGTDTVLMEYISIQMINNKLTYIARPNGQAMVSFTIKESGNGKFVFENKANDYPQKLTYQKMPNDSLSITLDGVANGIERSITFRYAKE